MTDDPALPETPPPASNLPQWEEPIAPASRPGGLTVLAMCNYTFGGLHILNFVLTPLLVLMMPKIREVHEENKELIASQPPADGALGGIQNMAINMGDVSVEMLSTKVILTAAFLGLLMAILMIISAKGYLQLKKVRGRYVGNLFCLVGLISMITFALMSKMNLLLHSIDLIYPVITFFLINITFKNDLVR